MLGSVLKVPDLKYVVHRSCISKSNYGAIKERESKELENLEIQKVMTGEQENNFLYMKTMDGDWITAVTHCLDGMELSRG